MKKICSLLLVTMLILAGCGGSKDTASDNSGNANVSDVTNTQTSTEADVATNDTDIVEEVLPGYVFSHNGVNFTVDMEVSAIIDALGEPASYYEVPSCAFEGLEKIYDYTSFEITTYESGDADYIANIYLKDDLVETPEGVSLFMTADDMLAAYGEDNTASEGQYVYTKDNMKLIFIVTDGEILSIQYASTFLD